VGDFVFRSVFHSGRIFSHTLLFALLFLIPALVWYFRTRRTWLLALALGISSHLVLDFMWSSPQTFYWPLYGWTFPGNDQSEILGVWLRSLLENPSVYVPEILGAVAFFVWAAWKYRTLKKPASRSPS